MSELTQPTGSRLSLALESAGMSEAELAGKVGVTRQAINQIVKGEKMPSLALAGAIARVVGHTVDALFLAAESSSTLDHTRETANAPAGRSVPPQAAVAGEQVSRSIDEDRTGEAEAAVERP